MCALEKEREYVHVCVCMCVWMLFLFVCECVFVVPWWCSGKHGVLPFHRLVVQIPPGVEGVSHFFTHFVL